MLPAYAHRNVQPSHWINKMMHQSENHTCTNIQSEELGAGNSLAKHKTVNETMKQLICISDNAAYGHKSSCQNCKIITPSPPPTPHPKKVKSYENYWCSNFVCLIVQSDPNFAHAMVIEVSWHVQTYDLIAPLVFM